MNKYLYLLLDKLYQYPKSIMFLLLMGAALLSGQLSRLQLDASADSLVLEGDRSLQIYREVNQKYGSEEFLIVTFSPSSDLFSDAMLGRIDRLKAALEALPEVSSVVTILDVPLLYSPPVRMSELSSGIRFLSSASTDRVLAKAEFLSSPLYSQLLTSSSFDTTAIQINLKRDDEYFRLLSARNLLRDRQRQGRLVEGERSALKKAESDFSNYSVDANQRQEQLIEKVRLIMDGHRAAGTLFLGGVPMIASDMIDFIENDLIVFGVGIVIFIILLLALIFRRIAWVVLPLLTCLVVALGMLGLLASLDWKLTVISSNFVALVMIITLSITIHLAVRYRELSRSFSGNDRRTLVMNTVRFMARPCFYTTITTVIAFASLVVSGIRPVIDFGWMMTIGVSAALLVSFLMIPAGLLLLPLGLTADSKPSPTRRRAFTYYFARFTDRHGPWVWCVSAGLLVASIIGIARLQVENRFIDYFDSSTEIYKGMEIIDRKLGGTIPLDIIIREDQPFESGVPGQEVAGAIGEMDADLDDIFGGNEVDPASGYWFSKQGLTEIETLHHYLDSLEQTGKVLSLASIYQVIKDVTGSDIDDFQLAVIGRNLSPDIKRVLIKPYLSDDGGETRISVRVKETSRQLKRETLLRQIDHYLRDEMGLKVGQYELTGMLVLYNNMLQSLFSSQILTLGAVFLAITTMFSLLFRSFFLALIAITPNLLAAGMVLGGMGLLGIPLDMMTITVAAITVGIGVDDTIHYIHRFKKEFAKDRDYVATMYRCHGSIGRAMFYTSIIIMIGFSILSLSNFKPTIYFGLLTGFAMFSALLGALLLLPQLMIALKPFSEAGDS